MARSIVTPTSLIRGGNGPTRLADTETTSPINLSLKSFLASKTAGLNRSTCPVASFTPSFLAARTISLASFKVKAMGFSTSTCFPCSMALMTTS